MLMYIVCVMELKWLINNYVRKSEILALLCTHFFINSSFFTDKSSFYDIILTPLLKIAFDVLGSISIAMINFLLGKRLIFYLFWTCCAIVGAVEAQSLPVTGNEVLLKCAAFCTNSHDRKGKST